MLSPNDVLVSTTSTIEGATIKKYIKPISAHVVAGTNFFSDFFASFSDVFGGRSETYQKQLSSIYTEAIVNLKRSAYEIGANCIVGLSVDLDEISGKGKSMFMVTATGTAVILEYPVKDAETKVIADEKFENVSSEHLVVLRTKKAILEQAASGKLEWENSTWNFVTQNRITEIFPYILVKWRTLLNNNLEEETFKNFYLKTIDYLGALSEEIRCKLVYDALINENDEVVVPKFTSLIRTLQLLNLPFVKAYLLSDNFDHRKRALKPLQSDKPFYNKDDVQHLKEILSLIERSFPERGQRSYKKQMLSSKEKEIWTCECGKQNDIGTHCSNCKKDIYGFKADEVDPEYAAKLVKEKIELIESCLN
jgi:uncharacterized protein YbjQ (UPF0145 family)